MKYIISEHPLTYEDASVLALTYNNTNVDLNTSYTDTDCRTSTLDPRRI